MEMFVEPRVRSLVAEHLGVGIEKLVSRVTLREDLAADSLDLVELAMVLEGEFGIVVAERVLDEVRTYGDLVTAISLLVREGRDAERHRAPPPRVWARITRAAHEAGGALERTACLTPYVARVIFEDALAAGDRSRLEMTVATRSGSVLARVRLRFAPLLLRGIEVTVRCGDGPAPPIADRASDHTDGPGENGRSHLAIQGSKARLDMVGPVTLRGGVGPTMDLLPPSASEG
jgi:acyl carrier protein